MATKLWIRELNGKAASLVGKLPDGTLRVRIDKHDQIVTRDDWESAPLWTGPSPYARDEDSTVGD